MSVNSADLLATQQLSKRWPMSELIQDQQRVRSTLTSLSTGKVVTFYLNPNYIDEINDPVQAVFPTASSFHVYRWMNEPTKWTIRGYAGLIGMNLHREIEALIGETNVQWHFPYLGADKFVRIDQVSLPKRGETPFSVYYSIQMQELTPKLNLALINTILPNRITPAFVSPNTAALAAVEGATAIGSIPVLPTWSSLNDAANYIWQQHFSRLDVSTLTGRMTDLNQTMNEPWLTAGQPINQNTLAVEADLLFPIAS